MTIRREVDWFGRMISRATPLSGVSEVFASAGVLWGVGGDAIAIKVEQPDTLTYLITSVSQKSADDFDIEETYSNRLIGREINQVDVTGGRTWWGKRVRYRWYQDGANLTVLPPKGESESA